jgi:hypothetical protein
VGVPLLQRRRRGVEPTPAGRGPAGAGARRAGGLERLRSDLAAFGQGVQGSVRVLASPSVLAERCPTTWPLPGSSAARHPHQPGRARQHRHRARPARGHGRPGRAVGRGRPERPADVLPYRSDRLCVAMSPSHPLARRPRCALPTRWTSVSVGVSPGGQMDQLLRRQAALLGGCRRTACRCRALDAACRHGRRGAGPGHPAAGSRGTACRRRPAGAGAAGEPWARHRWCRRRRRCWRGGWARPRAEGGLWRPRAGRNVAGIGGKGASTKLTHRHAAWHLGAQVLERQVVERFLRGAPPFPSNPEESTWTFASLSPSWALPRW